ncbi:hypothetical protein [Mycolicibacterium sarraceniae]|uniref:Cytochrome P450 n=1 Tax=Mycolicibacterium sarraceniae TaxID=1534348 RepID=A0A7I7STF3_9MYCO|nr:hypothetical protein [Mycolicibacterium sarraceniae]BBY60267.1 hypothetical protein MSAR_34030 [Mycolicibacterium sarraceniae]
MTGGVGVPRHARADIDAEFFAHPDRLDLTRTGAAHVGFGYGLHYCVGAALARLELKTFHSPLIPRVPDPAAAR